MGATLALVAVLVGTVAASADVPNANGPSLRAAPMVDVRPASALTSHAALYVNATPPSGTFPPGEELSAAYSVWVPSYTSNLGSATVQIPSAVVLLPSTSGTLHLYLNEVNLTVAGLSAVSGVAGPLTRFSSGLTFNTTASGILTTEGVAVMASWPYGGPAVQFRWHWTMTAPDGSTSSGPWSSWASVVPAQLAILEAPISHTWTIGSAYEMCFGGPIAGRTFSVHVATSNPIGQIDAGATSVPADHLGVYCWNSTLPSAVAAQQGFIHLWEYGNITFLLYVILIQLVNGTNGGAGSDGGTAGAPFLTIVLFGAGAVVVVVAIELVVLARSGRLRRAFPKTSAPPEPKTPPTPTGTNEPAGGNGTRG